MIIDKIVTRYFANTTSENSHYKAWDLCYNFFRNYKEIKRDNKLKDNACLNITAYLSSMGVYNAHLNKTNYLIHRGAINIILKSRYDVLWEYDINDTKLFKWCKQLIIDLNTELIQYYSRVCEGIDDLTNLTSHLIMGSMGCLPAFDKYFINGIDFYGFEKHTFCDEAIDEVYSFYKSYQKQFYNIFSSLDKQIPIMRIIYMFFWQSGYLSRITSNISAEAMDLLSSNSFEYMRMKSSIKLQSNKTNGKTYERKVSKSYVNDVPVWKLVKDAAEELLSFSVDDMYNHFRINNIDINYETLFIIFKMCSVNSSQRINWAVNQRERVSDGKYDFLYENSDDSYELYSPVKHGMWRIVKMNGDFIVTST